MRIGTRPGRRAQDVVVGRPRDGDDRVAWLLDHGHFTAALGVLEADRGLRPATHQQARPRPTACPEAGP